MLQQQSKNNQVLNENNSEHQLSMNLKCQDDLRSKLNMLTSQQHAGHKLDKATFDQMQSLIKHLKLQLHEKITEQNILFGNSVEAVNEEETVEGEEENSVEALSPVNSYISNRSNEYRASTKDEQLKEDSSCDTIFENDNASNRS